MVTRLRLLQAKDSKLKSFVKLLFVEKSDDLGTQYREVVSNSFGEILEWPKGFFDQASNDVRELVREISNKKSKAKTETNTSGV
jgi:predicted ATPase